MLRTPYDGRIRKLDQYTNSLTTGTIDKSLMNEYYLSLNCIEQRQNTIRRLRILFDKEIIVTPSAGRLVATYSPAYSLSSFITDGEPQTGQCIPS